MTYLASLINLTNWGRLALLATLITVFSLLIACSSGSDSTEDVAAPATEADDALAEFPRSLSQKSRSPLTIT